MYLQTTNNVARTIKLLIAALPLLLLVSTLQADVRRLVFDPPREANFRQKNGTLGQGLLVSVDPNTVRIRLPNGEDKDIPLDVMQVLRTIDTQFMYTDKDNIEEVITKASQLNNVIITSAPGNSTPTDKPADTSSMNGGFGAATNNNAMNNGGFGTAKPGSNNGGFGTPQASESEPAMVVICDNCQKEVHVTADYGQNCPHCGIEWSLDIPQNSFTNSGERGGQAGNGQQANANGVPGAVPNSRPVNPLNGPQVAPPSTNLPPAGQAASQEFDMANLPVWMKAGLFFLFAGAGYYMFFYRA